MHKYRYDNDMFVPNTYQNFIYTVVSQLTWYEWYSVSCYYCCLNIPSVMERFVLHFRGDCSAWRLAWACDRKLFLLTGWYWESDLSGMSKAGRSILPGLDLYNSFGHDLSLSLLLLLWKIMVKKEWFIIICFCFVFCRYPLNVIIPAICTSMYFLLLFINCQL